VNNVVGYFWEASVGNGDCKILWHLYYVCCAFKHLDGTELKNI